MTGFAPAEDGMRIMRRTVGKSHMVMTWENAEDDHFKPCRGIWGLALATILAISSAPVPSLAEEADKPSYPTISKTVLDEDAPADGWAENADASLGERLSFRALLPA